MIKRVLFRALRALGASLGGLVAARYGSHPIYGPLVTTGLLTADKLIREAIARGDRPKK